MDHSDEAYAPCPPRKFPDSLLESRHRFRREAPLRWLVIREAETQEFPFPWSSHRTLLAVHSKLKLRREESRHAAHHPFTGSPTADVDVAVSGPGESHPEALVQPYVRLTTHTAPITEPRRTPICQWANSAGERREMLAIQCVALRRWLRSLLYFRLAQRAKSRSSWRMGG